MTDTEPRNVVALVDTDRVLTLEGQRGLSALPETEPWPDLSDIAVACGVSTVLPLGPAFRLADQDAVIHVVSGVGVSSRADASWSSLGSNDSGDLGASVVDVISAAVAQHDGAAPRPPRRPDWFRRGWLADIDAWIDERLDIAGVERIGSTVPARLWSLSAVLSTPVRGPAGETSVWFKATCDWFRAEPAITEVLGSIASRHVPTVLAVDRERAWMLMESLPGTALRESPELAEAVASVVAKVQIDALGHQAALTSAGCPDRTLQPSLDAFRRLVHDSIELPVLTADERESAIELEPWVATQLEELFACGIPTSLVHGDLHLGNVAGDEQHVVLYDWTDACTSHPFLDGVHLARSAGDEHRDAVRDAYLGPWREAFAEADVSRAWELAVFGNRVFQAISYEAIYRAQEDASRWEMAGIVANTLREFGSEFRSGDRDPGT